MVRDFVDDREGCLFIATIHRKTLIGEPKPEGSPKGSPKTADKIIDLISKEASITTKQLGESLGISKRAILKQIDKLKRQNRLRRVGPSRGGYWEVLE